MDLILGKPLKRYFLEHVKRDDKQYVVTKPLHVFKKIRTGGGVGPSPPSRISSSQSEPA